MAEVSLKIGDMVHTPGGRDGRIAEFSYDAKKVQVKFSFGKQYGWYDVTDVKLVQAPQARQAAQSGNGTESYPVGKLFKNVAGEAVKVISHWKDLIRLQPGGAVELTDFEPKGESFTLSEDDMGLWLLKWLKPGDVVETVDGRVVILREMRLNEQISEAEQREYHLGIRFASENPLAHSVGTLYADSIEGKVTAPIAEAFRILAQPGSTQQQQQTIDSLRAECTMLRRQVDDLKAGKPVVNAVDSDKLAQAVEDAAKAKAALMDAEKRIRILEDKNRQQSKLLSEATVPVQNTKPFVDVKHIKTLVSIGGTAGFPNVEIPPGYNVAAITTEFRPTPGTAQIYRFVHVIGCGDSDNFPLYEAKIERIPVMDDEPLNSFEAALKGNYAPEDVIAVGNERVINMAWEAAQSRRAAYQPVPMMLTGGHDD